jgi:hypothetical protein
MIKKMSAAAFIAAASVSFVAVAQAQDFNAAPLNAGPAKVTGLGPVGDLANVALIPTNVFLQPFAPLSPAPAPVAEPVRRHHRHHHHM